LLVAADDAQWLDRASLDALAFAVRRLESEELVLLAGARGNVPPAGFERDFPQLLLAPLSLPDAGRLLDTQPRPPRGRPREQVLAQAAGNPLALIELAKMIAAHRARAARLGEDARRAPGGGPPRARGADPADRAADRHHDGPVRRPARLG